MPKNENNPLEVKVLKASLDFAGVSAAIKDIIRSALNNEYGDSLKTVGKLLSGELDSPEGQLHNLVWTASTNAFIQILKNKFGERLESFYGRTEEEIFIKSEVGQLLMQVEFKADPDFLAEPHRHPQTQVLKDFFKNWLIDTLKISEEQASVSVAAFPRLFLTEFNRIDPATYQKLLDYFQRPAYNALKKEHLIEAYHAHIMAEYDRPAFSDLRVSLDDMYVEPYFLYYKPEKDEEHKGSRDDFYKPKKNIPLHAFLVEWLKNNASSKIPKTNAPVMLLLGQPGQGKSSFVYRTVYKLLSEENDAVERVFLIRLRDLSNAEENTLLRTPLDVILERINKKGFDNYQLEKKDFDQSLIILDGLDELFMNRSLSLDDINTLITNLQKDIKEQAEKVSNKAHLKCLITSRHNYIRLQEFKSSPDLLALSLAEMQLSQQQQWLDRYDAHSRRLLPEDQYVAVAECLTQVNKKIKELDKLKENEDNNEVKNLRELLNQPILLQLIVEARADLNNQANRASVYHNIFDAITERKYAKGVKIPGLAKIEKEDYRRFLQVLAMQIYHSPKLYIRRSDFDKEPLKSEVARLCKISGDALQPQTLAKDLMVGFYFRSVRKEGDKDENDLRENYAFEFMHNSLFEFLVAEHIWSYFINDLTDKNQRLKIFDTDFNSAFQGVFQLFGPRLLSNEVVDYINSLILEDTNNQRLHILFDRLKTELYPQMIEHDFLTEYRFNQEGITYQPLNAGIAVFYGLITVMSCLSFRFVPHKGPWPTALENDFEKKTKINHASANFIHQKNIDKSANFIVFLTRINYNAQLILIAQNLRRADLYGADLRDVILDGSDIRDADLSSANLRRASIIGASLTGTYFSRADLSGAFLSGALLNGAILVESYLSGVSLRRASLRGADFSGASLRGADLSRASLRKADLAGADLAGADLAGADLAGINFRGNLFYGQVKNLLQSKNLNLARNLDKADFTGTPLEGKIKKLPDGTFEIEGYDPSINET